MKKPLTQDEAELIRKAMSVIGSRTSEKKKKSSAANIAAHRPIAKPLLELNCTCTGGEVFTAEAHTSRCPRGRAIRRRVAAGQPLE